MSITRSILIFNASPSGKSGNCSLLVNRISKTCRTRPALKKQKVELVHLADVDWSPASKKKIISQITSAAGIFFVTGTYWDSWGSPLQIFFENMTDLEGRDSIVGKPAVVCVLNHSVGGKGVLSRMQGVLSTLGFLIPPMSGMVFSWINQEVTKKKGHKDAVKDLWSLEDLGPIVENFEKALDLNIKWKSWPVDRNDYRKVWIET